MQEKLTELCVKQQIFVQEHKKELFFFFSVAILIFAFLLPNTAFATGTDNVIQKGVNEGASRIWKIIATIVVPIGGCLLAWNVFTAIFGGERGMEAAKKNILIIVLVLILVFLAPQIVNMIAGWFSGSAKWQEFTGIK